MIGKGRKRLQLAPIEVKANAFNAQRPSKAAYVRAALDGVNGWDREGVFTEVKDWLTKNAPNHGIEKDETLTHDD